MTTSKARAKKRIQRKNGFFLCPHQGCIWRSKVLSSVSRHRISHSITPRFVCEDCGAANMRADSHERHVDTCLKDRRANLMRKGKPPKFSTANQFRQAFPLAEEEDQQVLLELTDQLQRENEEMRLELIRKDETIAGLERQLVAGRADLPPLMVEDNDMITIRQSKELSPSSSPPSSPPAGVDVEIDWEEEDDLVLTLSPSPTPSPELVSTSPSPPAEVEVNIRGVPNAKKSGMN